MATLYEIDAAILNCVDFETGEILDAEQLNMLQMDREKKLENIALYIKDLTAQAAAIREEENALAARRRVKERAADRLKNYLSASLGGKGFESARVRIGYIKSQALKVDNEAELLGYLAENGMDKCWKTKTELCKKELTDLIKMGYEIPGCGLEERQNIQIN